MIIDGTACEHNPDCGCIMTIFTDQIVPKILHMLAPPIDIASLRNVLIPDLWVHYDSLNIIIHHNAPTVLLRLRVAPPIDISFHLKKRTKPCGCIMTLSKDTS